MVGTEARIAAVVGDRRLVQRDVQVTADQDALAAQVARSSQVVTVSSVVRASCRRR
jgi:hypothetical protein